MVCAISAATAGTVLAETFTLTEPGTFTVIFNGNSNTTDVNELSGEATIHFLGFTTTANGDTIAEFDVTLSNTTEAPLTSRITGFGFDVDPDAIDGSVSGVFTELILNGSLPNQFGPVEVCVNDSSDNSCAGGGGGGVLTGTTESFVLTLFFSGAVDTLVLDNFGIRYQSISGESINGTTYRDASGTGTGTPGQFSPDPDPSVPEPASILLFGVALLGFAAVMRRRRQPLNRVQ